MRLTLSRLRDASGVDAVHPTYERGCRLWRQPRGSCSLARCWFLHGGQIAADVITVDAIDVAAGGLQLFDHSGVAAVQVLDSADDRLAFRRQRGHDECRSGAEVRRTDGRGL